MRAFTRLALLPIAMMIGAPALVANAAVEPALTIERAERELAEAKSRAAALERDADKAADALSRLQAAQRAAAAAIEESEARITLADLKFRRAEAAAKAAKERLVEAQRPASRLLAGLALMGERPPLVALADRTSVDSLVRTRILVDSTLPVIRRRTAALAGEVERTGRFARAAGAARTQLNRSRNQLVERRTAYAALERRALEAAAKAGGAALGAGDQALAAGEAVARARSIEERSASVRAIAGELAAGPAVPARPGGEADVSSRAPFAYRLPVAADVVQGLGAIDDNGVRSRGITLRTGRGVPVMVPATGVIRHSGPFHDFDGVIIIDHGRGWMSLLVNVASPLKVGQRVALGEPLGRALGPISLELSHNGRRQSPALIAGSSAPLSKGGKGG